MILFSVREVYDMNVTVAVFPPFPREHRRVRASKEVGVAPASWVSDLSVILSRWRSRFGERCRTTEQRRRNGRDEPPFID